MDIGKLYNLECTLLVKNQFLGIEGGEAQQ